MISHRYGTTMEGDDVSFVDPLSSNGEPPEAFSYESQITWASQEPPVDDMKTIDLNTPNTDKPIEPKEPKELVNHAVASSSMQESMRQEEELVPHQQPIVTTRLHYASSPSTSSSRDAAGPSSSQVPPPSSPPPQWSLRPSLRSSPLVIKVTDPIKKEQSSIFGISSSYTSYLVTSQPSDGSSSSRAVRRRFNDFMLLADVLKATYRGYFLPPRPEKNAGLEGQRMSSESFVEDRRSSLESYLRQLTGHLEISSGEVLRVFLTDPLGLTESSTWWSLTPLHLQRANGGGGGLLLEGTTKLAKQIMGQEKKVLDPLQAALPTRGVLDPLRAMKETAQSMHQGNHGSSPSALRSPDEAALSRASLGLEVYKEALLATSRAAEHFIQIMDARALVDGDLGLALHKVAGYEEAHGTTLAQLTGTVRQHQQIVAAGQSSSSALIKAARVGRTATGKAASELASLHDYLALMPNAWRGLRHREKQLLTAETLDADQARMIRSISVLEAANAKILGGDPVRMRRVEELKDESSRLDQSILAARAEYEKIRGVNFRELSRLQGDMRLDFEHMVRQFAAGQAASAERNLEVWLQAAGELGVDEGEVEEVRRVSQMG